MAYSLRTRSASAATETPAAPVKKAAVKKAPAKKAAASPKKAPAAPKKSAAEAKKEEPAVVEAKVKAPAKPKAPAKKAAPKAKAAATAKAPAKKAAPPKKAPVAKKVTKAAPKAKAPARKAAAAKKEVEKKAAPIVKIEEIDEELNAPSMPEVEPIVHEEKEEEKVIEIVEGQVVSTHIRFSDAEEEEEEGEIKPDAKEVSIDSEDFEALDEMKDEPAPFELYNSEESESEMSAEKEANNFDDEFDESMEKVEVEEAEEIVKEPSPVSNAHSAFEAFTSQEETKSFNWSHSGSTYYNEPSESEPEAKEAEMEVEAEVEPEPEVAKIEDMPSVIVAEKEAVKTSPVVISNPFGFGFTAIPAPAPEVAISASALSSLSSKPNPYTFNNYNSNFQSVSSPLDKLCNLTSQANPMAVASTFGMSNNSNSMMATSSYLPTSPAAGMSKASRSPSINGEDKEAHSPSAIQSIIVDDKHEDFSAF